MSKYIFKNEHKQVKTSSTKQICINMNVNVQNIVSYINAENTVCYNDLVDAHIPEIPETVIC